MQSTPNNRPRKALAATGKCFVGAAIFLHFAFLISDVTHLTNLLNRREKLTESSVLRLWNSAADYYGSLTFSNRNFGFFAPKITSDWVVEMALSDATGRQSEHQFEILSKEMEFKAYAMLGHFAASDSRMDLLSRFWSARAMQSVPGTRKVEVKVSRRVLPSMAEHRAGKRVHKEQFYRTVFER